MKMCTARFDLLDTALAPFLERCGEFGVPVIAMAEFVDHTTVTVMAERHRVSRLIMIGYTATDLTEEE